MTPDLPVREGDTIKHLPSGETWCVAGVYDNGDILCAGWPCSLGRAGEFVVTERCSDEEHEKMLSQCAGASVDPPCYYDPRKSLATHKLLRRVTAQHGDGI